MSSSNQERPSILASKPSSSFSTISSAASATSAATSRSAGSRLLFGEIDTNSDRSSESYASVSSFVLCDSSTFLKFWLVDLCRDRVLSYVPKEDLANLRLACHDFSVRAAPALFNDLSITFRTNTFTKPARLAALDRLGFYVKTLNFKFPHTADTFLPPLVDPETGAELSYTYTPQIEPPSPKRPKYGDVGTTEILTRQYQPLFHAATNVSAFVRALSAFVNLEHLKINCPGYEPANGSRRSVVDFALISLRIAVERNCLNALDTLTLSPMHPGGLLYLAPLIGFGATPRSASRWTRIRHLSIHLHSSPPASSSHGEQDHFKLLQTYLYNFQSNLTTFNFRWINEKGPFPVQRQPSPASPWGQHPALIGTGFARSQPLTATTARRTASRPLLFPRLKNLEVENVSTSAADISAFVAVHKSTLEDLNLEDFHLTSGTWDEALAPMTRLAQPARPSYDTVADIPIMLSPTTAAMPSAHPINMERVDVTRYGGANGGRPSMRLSRWLPSSRSSRRQSISGTRMEKVKEGILGCEEGLRKVLRGWI